MAGKRVLLEPAQKRFQVDITVVFSVEVDPAEVKREFGRCTKQLIIQHADNQVEYKEGMVLTSEIVDEWESSPARYAIRSPQSY